MAAARLIAGNWKMNGLRADLAEVAAVAEGAEAHRSAGTAVALCLPSTLLAHAASVDGVEQSALRLGGQDCHAERSGAFTGDVSAEMLKEAGATYCIVGHSERRAAYGESDALVAAKATAAAGAGLIPIICVGETLAEREAGEAISVVTRQVTGSVPTGLDQIIVAYEPVWAIGTGRAASLEDIAEIHGALRAQLGADALILYGGSVKPANAHEILSVKDVDGALVGGASLKAQDFLAIVKAA